MIFVFDKNYNNREQVREWFETFAAIREEMQERGEYPYNNSFRGLIPGIEGPDEDTAIYLLQGLCHLAEERQEIAALEADGFETLENLDAETRFAHVALYRESRYVGGTGSIQKWDAARIVAKDGKPYAVLPKGAKTRGHRIDAARVLVKS